MPDERQRHQGLPFSPTTADQQVYIIAQGHQRRRQQTRGDEAIRSTPGMTQTTQANDAGQMMESPSITARCGLHDVSIMLGPL